MNSDKVYILAKNIRFNPGRNLTHLVPDILVPRYSFVDLAQICCMFARALCKGIYKETAYFNKNLVSRSRFQ